MLFAKANQWVNIFLNYVHKSKIGILFVPLVSPDTSYTWHTKMPLMRTEKPEYNEATAFRYSFRSILSIPEILPGVTHRIYSFSIPAKYKSNPPKPPVLFDENTIIVWVRETPSLIKIGLNSSNSVLIFSPKLTGSLHPPFSKML